MEGEWLNGVPHGICIVESEGVRGVTILNNGKPNNLPAWLEFKENGSRASSQYSDEINPKGFIRFYNSDKDTYNIRSTSEKQLVPGWLNTFACNKGKKGIFIKTFT